MENVRYHNTEDWKEYIANAKNLQQIQKDVETLTVEEQMEEFVFLGLRKMQGISEQKFQEVFQKSIWECYGENIRKVMEKGLLDERDGNLYLTEKGIDISNYVFAEILCKLEN